LPQSIAIILALKNCFVNRVFFGDSAVSTIIEEERREKERAGRKKELEE